MKLPYKTPATVIAGVALMIAVSLFYAGTAEAQPATTEVSIQKSELSKLTLAKIDTIDVAKNRGAVVTAMAFGGQGLSRGGHRLAMPTTELRGQRSMSNFVLVQTPATSSAADRYARREFAGALKSYTLKLPPESPRRPKRFRFTPLMRSITGAPRDAVIH